MALLSSCTDLVTLKPPFSRQSLSKGWRLCVIRARKSLDLLSMLTLFSVLGFSTTTHHLLNTSTHNSKLQHASSSCRLASPPPHAGTLQLSSPRPGIRWPPDAPSPPAFYRPASSAYGCRSSPTTRRERASSGRRNANVWSASSRFGRATPAASSFRPSGQRSLSRNPCALRAEFSGEGGQGEAGQHAPAAR
jgi:hypothetical protein